MSIAVGLKHNNHVYIASDSQITVGEYKKPIQSVKSNKIWHPSGLPYIVLGTVRIFREGNVLQASSELINHQTYSQAKTFDIHYIGKVIMEQTELLASELSDPLILR